MNLNKFKDMFNVGVATYICMYMCLPYMVLKKSGNNPRDGTSPRTSHCVVRSFIKVYCRAILL